MKKISLFFIVFVGFVLNLSAQSYYPVFSEEKEKNQIETIEKDNVTIIQDKKISILIERHIKENKKENGMQGYRIRLFSDSGFNARHGAITLRTGFMKKYPEIPTYLEYIEPYYKIYIGDFRTKVDALKVYKQIRHKYPKAFIVRCKINFPELD